MHRTTRVLHSGEDGRALPFDQLHPDTAHRGPPVPAEKYPRGTYRDANGREVPSDPPPEPAKP